MEKYIEKIPGLEIIGSFTDPLLAIKAEACADCRECKGWPREAE